MNFLIKYLFSFRILFVLLSSTAFSQQSLPNNARLSPIKNGKEKLFYDANTNVLDSRDSLNAQYYRIVNYKEGKIYGTVTDYYKSGQPMMTGYYLDLHASKGSENGKFVWYYEDGKIFQSCNYINGLLEGPYSEYYPSGTKKAIVSYEKGIRYGCEFLWDEQGKLVQKGFNINGVLYNRAECDTILSEPKQTATNNKRQEVPKNEIEKKVCTQCDGSGFIKIATNCRVCGGTGKVTCGRCSGTGKWGDIYPTKGIWETPPCTNCSGTGRSKCSSCSGKGGTIRYITCTKCKGSGWMN